MVTFLAWWRRRRLRVLIIQPGDLLIVSFPGLPDLTQEDAARIRERLLGMLPGLDPVLLPGAEFAVVRQHAED